MACVHLLLPPRLLDSHGLQHVAASALRRGRGAHHRLVGVQDDMCCLQRCWLHRLVAVVAEQVAVQLVAGVVAREPLLDAVPLHNHLRQ